MAIRSVAALLALLSCTAPLQAQTIRDPALAGASPVAMGSFVGARLRIPLGGTKGSEPIRAGLTVAPMQRSGGAGDVAPVWRIGDGLEFGFTSDAPVAHVSLAGQYLGPARYAPGGKASAKARTNLSDGETVAAVVVGLALLAGGGLLLALDAAGDPDPCEPGGCNNN